MAGAGSKSSPHTEDWRKLPWKAYQRNVRRLQQRIYRAERRGDGKRVHNLQRLLLRSWSARCLAVRRVTQDNRGKRTPGVDGVTSLTPPQRLALARTLRNLAGWQVASDGLAEVGLTLKPSKRITHTLHAYQGQAGLDFLGFHIRQYPVGQHRTRTYRGQPGYKTLIRPSNQAVKRHQTRLQDIIWRYRGLPQAALIAKLNPIIRGWTRYYRNGGAKRTFNKMDYLLYHKLAQWMRHRHPRKTRGWRLWRYCQQRRGRIAFTDGKTTLVNHADTPIIRHIKVRSDKSPFDGDWLYWGARLGRDPTKPKRVTKLVKRQQGRCAHCGLRLVAEEAMEVHHINGNRHDNRYLHLALLHTHCHDQTHGEWCQ